MGVQFGLLRFFIFVSVGLVMVLLNFHFSLLDVYSVISSSKLAYPTLPRSVIILECL